MPGLVEFPSVKPTKFLGSSKNDLSVFPVEVKYMVGHAIYLASLGRKHVAAKPLKGDAFKGAGVLEIVSDCDGDTFRAVYTVKFAGIVYVLHAFQKKSTKGIATPKREIDVIKLRLQAARRDYETNHAE